MSETDLPTLLRAVSQHLKTEVMPKLSGFDAFGVRVAANAVAIAEREVRARGELNRLSDDLCRWATPAADETPAQAVARALRDGQLQASPALTAALRHWALQRLAVDNPRYSGYQQAKARWGNGSAVDDT